MQLSYNSTMGYAIYVHAYKYNTEPTEPTHHLFWPDCSDQWNDQLQYNYGDCYSLRSVNTVATYTCYHWRQHQDLWEWSSAVVRMPVSHCWYWCTTCTVSSPQLCALTPMESYVVDHLTTDQWVLQLLTSVTMASVLLESVEHVGVTEPGVDQLRCLSVSGISCKPNIRCLTSNYYLDTSL